MFKQGMMNMNVTGTQARWIMFGLLIVLVATAAFMLGMIHQLEAMTAPRETDSIIDGTCREILRYENEREDDAVSP